MKSPHFRTNESSIEWERHGKCLAAPRRETQRIIENLVVSDGLTGGKCKEQAIKAVIVTNSITVMAGKKAIR